jgi:hypothetical protein
MLSVVSVLIPAVSIDFFAQSESVSLVNTVWKGPQIETTTSTGPATLSPYLLFERNGKVSECVIAVLPSGLESTPNFFNPMYNPIPWAFQEGGEPYSANSPYRYNLTMTPGITRMSEVAGKYRIQGRTVYMEFPESSRIGQLRDDEFIVSVGLGSGKKQEWTYKRIPNALLRRQRSTSSATSEALASLQEEKISTQEVIAKYNPTKFTSDTISGELVAGDGEKYFYFTAIPGELKISLAVVAEARSSFNNVQVALYDPNESSLITSGLRQIGLLNTMVNYGRSSQKVLTVSFSKRMPVLVQIKASNLGSARYTLRLEGAHDAK